MKKIGVLRIIFIMLIIAALFLKLFSVLYINYSWFKDIGYSQLFTTPIIAKFQIGLIAFAVYFLIIFTMLFVAFRVFVNAEKEQVQIKSKLRLYVVGNTEGSEEKDITPINTKKIVSVLLIISVIISLFLALGATETGWMKLLEFRNASNFGIIENVFNKDISFYVFKMPLYNFVLDSLASSLTIIFFISIIFYSVTGLVTIKGSLLRREGLNVPVSIRRFWAILVSLLFILVGLKKYLSMYTIMYSQTGYVYGAGYTDIFVTVPLAKILAVIALLSGVASLIYFFVNDHRIIFGGLAVYLAVSLLGSVAFSFTQYNVSNNEFIKEKRYIEEEIKFTRLAYNLNKIIVKDYPGTAKITMDNIKNNKETLENIRLNDPIPLKTVLSQNQGLRYYYRFNDIDVDRYKVDDKYRQVLLSAREISEEALTEKAGTFVNLTMRYTHGYGLTATLANEIDDSGYAKLIVKDIPPQSQVKGIDIKEPRIYYGELTNDTQYGYVIGNTGAKEFDYPQGDNNAENTYQGTTGLAFKGLDKLFLSAYFNTFRFYMAGEIKDNSKLLMKRNILDRVNTLMPYLKYDHDPYIVAAKDGKLYWIIDAYTSTDKFPYSAPVGNLNYIRNSVKVVVDPYNGTVNFYTFDKQDSMLKTISRIFPGVFKDSSQMPSDLMEHTRYPEDYFSIQSNILLNFHVDNPSVFYNREDTWDIAKKMGDGKTNNIEPYYSVMKLPNEDTGEFTLTLPFTPASRENQARNNLVAWLTARSDGKNYGQLVLYKVPKNVEIQGPLMIDSLIDQDTSISGKMTLWGQGGSQVIRGNLLAVPIDDGFIYVEPIYIKAAQQGASIPQMQAIVFAIDKKIIMVETNSLDKAIAEFFAKQGMTSTGESAEKPQTPKLVTPKDSILKKIQLLKQQLQDLEQSINSLPSTSTLNQ
jgi:uncharacterized membrane protein (UPF0182 family)